jgi:hypothetical protein
MLAVVERLDQGNELADAMARHDAVASQRIVSRAMS